MNLITFANLKNFLIYSNAIITTKFISGLANFYSKNLVFNFITLIEHYFIKLKLAKFIQIASKKYLR